MALFCCRNVSLNVLLSSGHGKGRGILTTTQSRYCIHYAGPETVRNIYTQADVRKLAKAIDQVRLVLIHTGRLCNLVSWTIQTSGLVVGDGAAKPALFHCAGPPDTEDDPGATLVPRGDGSEQAEVALWLLTAENDRPAWEAIPSALNIHVEPALDAGLTAFRLPTAGDGSVRNRQVLDALLPECATTGYAYDFSRLKPAEIANALADVSQMAARFRLNVLVGSPVFRRRSLYNCLVAFDRQGAVVHCYAKCHLTEVDRKDFSPGNAVALFEIDGICATTVICHERRYPELVRLAVMAGAIILFHPNAGMDSLAVSRWKRGGRDGIAVRAFENAIYYVFANSVGFQGGGMWSTGDSKIVGPDERVLGLADNRNEAVIVANLDLSKATGVYARRGLTDHPFLDPYWKRIVDAVRRQAAKSSRSDEGTALWA